MSEIRERRAYQKGKAKPQVVYNGRTAYLSVVPVRLSANGKDFDTHAVIDSGVGYNSIRKEVVDVLGLRFPCARVQFSLSSRCGTYSEKVTSVTESKLKFAPGAVDAAALRSQWRHLQDVDIESTVDKEVTVLIGIGVAGAHRVFETISPPGGLGPRAIRTPFGWIAVGETEPYVARRQLTDSASLCDRIRRGIANLFRSSCGSFENRMIVSTVYHCVVPVRLSANDIQIDTYALIDGGSSGNSIDGDLAVALDLVATLGDVSIETPYGTQRLIGHEFVQFTVSSRSGSYSTSIIAHTGSVFSQSTLGHVDPVVLKRRWRHLSDVDIQSTEGRAATVRIGIGAAGAHQVFETIPPPEGTLGPRAIRTPFGWIAVGYTGDGPQETKKCCSF